MAFDRRAFLRLAGLSAAAVAAAGCAPLSHPFGSPTIPAGSENVLPDADWRSLARMCYGPGQVEQMRVAQIGVGGWLEEQLGSAAPEPGLRWRLRNLDLIDRQADELDHYKKEQAITGLRQASLLRQVYSERQLYEMMVEFWTDHFNISMEKGDGWRLKVVDDREVIREHALGNFRELLGASTRSPAMLVYLDNQANIQRAPNENYARELLELHTLGVNGGYSQADVMDLARCLTGWSVKEHFWRGEFTFKEGDHDPGAKTVLGMRLESSSEREVERVLDRLALHPATAQHLAEKMVRRFICDDPPSSRPELVARAAENFLQSGGEVSVMLRTILFDGLVGETGGLPQKFKRPVDFIVSALRVLGADTDGGEPLQQYLLRMGHPTFTWPTPDGPPDVVETWSTNLAPRWHFALAMGQGDLTGTSFELEKLAGGTLDRHPSQVIEAISLRLLGLKLAGEARDRIEAAFRVSDLSGERNKLNALVAGLIASPHFQYR